MDENKDSRSNIPPEILASIDQKNKIDEGNAWHIQIIKRLDLYLGFVSRTLPTLFGLIKLIFIAFIFYKIIKSYIITDKFNIETITINTLGIFKEKITNTISIF